MRYRGSIVAAAPKEGGFRVRGEDRDGEVVFISWTEDSGFDDPTGTTAVLIATKATVAATATGPYFDAAAKPAHVALLTAVEALRDVDRVWVDRAVLDELQRLSEIPAGAVS